MEYLPLGDLEHYLEAPLPESQACIISRQILQGLVFMHENKFAHRDMKPAVSAKSIKSVQLYVGKHILMLPLEHSCLQRRAQVVG